MAGLIPRRPPRSRTRAWPAAAGVASGALASYLGLRRMRAHALSARRGYDVPDGIDIGGSEFLRAVQGMTGAVVSEGNTIAPLVNGDEIFPVLLDTIRGAERTLNLLTYVYWSGEIAVEVAEAVAERARAGVECNVLLDAVGAAKIDDALVQRMERAGVSVARFRPVGRFAVGRLNNRTHRKILVADGRVGLIGGVGIASEWTGDAQDPDHWRDTHFLVHGPVVTQMHGAFAENWLEATGALLAGDRYMPEQRPLRGGVPMQMVRSGAACGATDVEALFFLALRSARRSIRLATAYFAPRPAFVDELVRAAGMGVETWLMVPGPHADKAVVRAAGFTDYGRLLRGGVHVLEYQPTMLHAKTFVVDGVWSVIGSVNFDARSFQLNDEAAMCVQDPGFASALERQYATDRADCHEITREDWRRRPLVTRARTAVARVVKAQL